MDDHNSWTSAYGRISSEETALRCGFTGCLGSPCAFSKVASIAAIFSSIVSLDKSVIKWYSHMMGWPSYISWPIRVQQLMQNGGRVALLIQETSQEHQYFNDTTY